MPRREARKASPGYLERAAVYYLERYASSVANLRNVLDRKVKRSVEAHGTDLAEGRQWIEDVLKKLVGLGLLNDAAYAAAKTRSLLRQGKPKRTIGMTLRAKGVGQDDLEHALASVEDPDADLRAAIVFARKRRFGPFGPKVDPAARQRQFAAFARRGFGYDLARKVLDAPSVEAVERLTGLD